MAIERKFIQQNIREYRVKRFIREELDRVGLSDVTVKKTPLGDKIIINASRPGLVVGRGGSNIQALTKALKEEFELENPQIEIEEIKKPDLDADIVAERICNSLERFGSGRTKGVGHKAMADVMRAGALGVEILITGKIPSMRARRWRFYNGYLKKSGDIAIEGVRKSIQSVTLKSGAIGVQVSIMPPTIKLPDHITLIDSPVQEVEETEEAVDASEDSSKQAPAEQAAKKEVAQKTKKKPSATKKEAAPAKKESAEKKQAPSDESAEDVEDKK
ncbi:MAG: 30S ribosomal protein S3 [Candidatus Woesearchaeota archaeon]